MHVKYNEEEENKETILEKVLDVLLKTSPLKTHWQLIETHQSFQSAKS